MKYLKVFTDFVKDMSELGEAERGRLFTAMLIYAGCGEESSLRGNERFLWGTAKKQIDSQREAYVERCEINKKNITSRYESLRNATNRYESKEEKEKEEEKEQEKDGLPFSQSVNTEIERLTDRLMLDFYDDKEFADAIRQAIRTMYESDYVRVNGQKIPRSAVVDVLNHLTVDHIDYVHQKLCECGEVVNGTAFLISCLYNAPIDCIITRKRATGK